MGGIFPFLCGIVVTCDKNNFGIISININSEASYTEIVFVHNKSEMNLKKKDTTSVHISLAKASHVTMPTCRGSGEGKPTTCPREEVTRYL